MSFKYIEIDTSKGLDDHEVEIKGIGLIVLSAPMKCYIKLNSRLADPIPAITIEKLYAKIDKIYITSPPDITNLKLIVIQDENIYVDANSNYDVVASTGAFMSQMILASARRGNKIEIHTLDPASSPIVISELYQAGPYLIDNLIGFQILSGNGDGWTLTAQALHPSGSDVLTTNISLSGLTTGDKVDLIAHSYTFTADSTAQSMTIAVDYLYIPIWSK